MTKMKEYPINTLSLRLNDTDYLVNLSSGFAVIHTTSDPYILTIEVLPKGGATDTPSNPAKGR